MAANIEAATVAVAAARGGYGRSERTMTQVVCSNCGKVTEVPFRASR